MDRSRDRRSAENEVMARLVNEAIDETGREEFSHAFLCECTRAHCQRMIELTPTAYDRLRTHSRRFVVAPGHVDEQIETPVESHASYTVVEKHGDAGRLAQARNPRK
jgi:hypothetical protein